MVLQQNLMRYFIKQNNRVASYRLIVRQPGCLGETHGFLSHPRGWFSVIGYLVVLCVLSAITIPKLFTCIISNLGKASMPVGDDSDKNPDKSPMDCKETRQLPRAESPIDRMNRISRINDKIVMRLHPKA